ncbi:YigZ family protein [Celerinatantimonas sp. YJH-8]
MSGAFEIPVASVSCEQTLKKSRFITQLGYVADREQASQWIEQMKQQYPDARHHCWAFIAGAPDDTQVLGFSDDGEPSGTAGKPILAQLQGSGLGYICAVVIRYFGGIKLGTGGLVRAYGSSVGQALELVERTPYIPLKPITFTFDFNHIGIVSQLAKQYQAEQTDVQYSHQVMMTLMMPAQHLSLFKSQLTNACSGKVEFIQVED